MKFEIVRIDYQKFCYHGSVTWRLLLSILPNEHDSVKLRDCRKRQKTMPRWPQIPIKIFSTYPPARTFFRLKAFPRTFFHRNEVLTNKCPAKEKMGQEKWKIKGGGKAKGKSRLGILRHFWTQNPSPMLLLRKLELRKVIFCIRNRNRRPRSARPVNQNTTWLASKRVFRQKSQCRMG